MKTNQAVEYATLTWDKEVPVSERFDDQYYSKQNGLKESEYVFLKANKLPERFTLSESESSNTKPFIVAETGFGTGLNFLVTWYAWQQLTTEKKPLHFISIEKYPLTKNDLATALSHWPQLKHLSEELLANYPLLLKGQHHISLDKGLVTLDLIIGDVNEDLEGYAFTADCWFLDGFSPKKNPEMWTDHLFRIIAKYSNQDTSISTFTISTKIRLALQAVGFELTKITGFGLKREMLTGRYKGSVDPSSIDAKQARWSLPDPESNISGTFNHPNKTNSTPKDLTKTEHKSESLKFDAIVIGAGLAGITTANKLAEKGLSVAILEQHSKPVSGASGQSQLVMYAKLPSQQNKVYRFIEHCLAYSFRYYQTKQTADAKNKFWHPSGVLQLAWNEKEQDKQQTFLENSTLPASFLKPVDASEASIHSGLSLTCGGLWFENAGWLEPRAYASLLLDDKNISLFFDTKVSHIKQDAETFDWTINTNNAVYQAQSVVIANANDAATIDQVKHFPTKPLRGQVTSIKTLIGLKEAKSVVCGEGYLCPPVANWHHFGATFDLDSTEILTNESDDHKNIANIQKWLPGWLSETHLEEAEIANNAGLRCTTPDYMPIVGLAPIFDDMVSTFEKLRVGANSCHKLYGHYHKNLYVNIGHGSKGLFTTPLSASLIANQICGSPAPFNEELRLMIAPGRFIIKHLKQRRI
jgi:tRNA 5-methylaminomethyl-2-thiouridine biosynthesis bifunctional protein